jgi:hypothetical protein
MEYYLGIADTLRYINYAKNYYNRFLMTIQVEYDSEERLNR